MKLLFDQNLSHRLIDLLQDLFPESSHVRALDLHQADDLAIWNHAKENGFVIVTQDADYADWNKLRGAPPKIIWIRCGNATVNQMHGSVVRRADDILWARDIFRVQGARRARIEIRNRRATQESEKRPVQSKNISAKRLESSGFPKIQNMSSVRRATLDCAARRNACA